MKCTNNNKPKHTQGVTGKTRMSCAFYGNTNTKKRMVALLCVTMLMFCGCAGNEKKLEQPYNVYQTTGSVGIGTSASGSDKAYFSQDLCVADDFPLGTDATDSQVAEGAGTFNLSTNTVVYAQNIYKKLYPASTTKILTAYIALKNCPDLNQTFTVSENAANQASDSSVCGLKAGDVISMHDMLYGLMLRSGNDAAIAIAEAIAGDVDSFAVLMNQEAEALGASRSHFMNPNGLPDDNHYTTVYDLYLIFNAAIQNDTFVDIISTKTIDVSYKDGAGGDVTQTWENTNQYMTGHTKAPEGFDIIGGKTGTTGEAGYCLVLYSKNEAGDSIISIVLKADAKTNLYLLMNEMLRGFAG